MTIKPVNQENFNLVQPVNGINKQEKDTLKIGEQKDSGHQVRSDSLEISANAKKLQSLQTIEQRIQSGFYNQPEVQRTVAQKISREFPPENK